MTPVWRILVGTKAGVFEFSQSTGSYIGRVGGAYVGTEFPDGFAVDGSGNFYLGKLGGIVRWARDADHRK